MGDVDPSALRAELRDALQGLGAGQLSPVIKLPAGYAILKALPPGEIPAIDQAEKARNSPSARRRACGSLSNLRPQRDGGGAGYLSQAGRLVPGLARRLRDARAVAGGGEGPGGTVS